MVTPIGPLDDGIILRFGGGINSRASEDEIDPRECADGQNFLLDLQNREYRTRPPFDLVGTLPNAAEVRGGITLRNSAGTVTTLFQGGDTVYDWDGATTFTSKATVDANAQLRGRLDHYWALDDKVIVTDLNLKETVAEWDGSTFSSTSFTDEAGSGFGNFFAKYCLITDERAMFANVTDPGASTPHMIVGSKRSQFEQITVSNRPSSALGEADPFFLLTPDLKPVNALADAFGRFAVSSAFGNMYVLTGDSAKDFAFDLLYSRSAADGDEAVAWVGNDIFFAQTGKIESLESSEKFGDVERDDISVKIAEDIDDFSDWTIVHNFRTGRTYFFADSQSDLWVYEQSLRKSDLSPWSKYVTAHSLAFQPTFAMNMLDPSDGLEYVFLGDGSGNVYRLEGTGTSGDGGTDEISTSRLSRLFRADFDAEAYDIEGWVKYRRLGNPASVTLTFEYAGTSIFDQSVTVPLDSTTGGNFYGGAVYYNGDFYYGATFKRRLVRQKFFVPGQSNEFQIRVGVTGNNPAEINEIGVRFKAASR